METASRTSVTARSMGVPIWNSMSVCAEPSLAMEEMLRTLPMPATAPSTFCRIWVSISEGAAPGWEIETSTIG